MDMVVVVCPCQNRISTILSKTSILKHCIVFEKQTYIFELTYFGRARHKS